MQVSGMQFKWGCHRLRTTALIFHKQFINWGLIYEPRRPFSFTPQYSVGFTLEGTGDAAEYCGAV